MATKACRSCGRRVELKVDGNFKRHFRPSGKVCSNSGGKP